MDKNDINMLIERFFDKWQEEPMNDMCIKLLINLYRKKQILTTDDEQYKNINFVIKQLETHINLIKIYDTEKPQFIKLMKTNIEAMKSSFL